MRYWSQWLRAWSLAAGLLLSACALPQADTSTSAYDRGLLAYQAGYYGLAAEELRQAVNQNPISVPALNALGATYDQIGRYDLAQRQYQRALAADPTSSQTLNNIGYSYLLQNRPDVAAVYLRDARRYSTAPEITETLSANLETAERALDDDAATPGEQTMAAITGEASPRIRRLTSKIQTMRTQPAARSPPVTKAEPAPLAVEIKAPAAPRPPGTRPTRPNRQETAAFVRPSPVSRPAIEAAARIEISNGADRLHMAERVRDYLQNRGQAIVRLSEAPHHSYRQSIIYYRGEQVAAAENLRQVLAPAAPKLLVKQRDGQRVDLVLRLGNDFLVFDQGLYENTANGTSGLANASPRPAPTPPVDTKQASLPRTKSADRRQARHQVQIEVANGMGRSNMAARMSDHFLATLGSQVSWITNAPSFDHRASHITYRPGARTAAAALRDVLPDGIDIREDAAQRADVKLTLGADLIDLDTQLAAQQTRATIEVSNGAGRYRMAASMGTYLKDRGLAVHRITNADHFRHETTTIFYRPGYRASAQELAAALPVPVRLLEDGPLATDLRLEMGRDLLGSNLAEGERSPPEGPG